MKQPSKKQLLLAAAILAAIISICLGYFALLDNWGTDFCDWSAKETNWISQGQPCAIRWEALFVITAFNFIGLNIVFIAIIIAAQACKKILRKLRIWLYGVESE